MNSKQSSLLSFTTDALCLAMKTALQLVNNEVANVEKEEPTEVLALAVSTALRLVDKEVEPLPQISLDQVSWHDTSNDCWIVIYDKVYDVTQFLGEHPGGDDVLLEYAGRDASLAFRGVGHSQAALKALEPFLVGILPKHERIFKDSLRLLQPNLEVGAVNG